MLGGLLLCCIEMIVAGFIYADVRVRWGGGGGAY